MKRAIGFTKEKIESFEELVEFMNSMFSFVKGEFMRFSFDTPP